MQQGQGKNDFSRWVGRYYPAKRLGVEHIPGGIGGVNIMFILYMILKIFKPFAHDFSDICRGV